MINVSRVAWKQCDLVYFGVDDFLSYVDNVLEEKRKPVTKLLQQSGEVMGAETVVAASTVLTHPCTPALSAVGQWFA